MPGKDGGSASPGLPPADAALHNAVVDALNVGRDVATALGFGSTSGQLSDGSWDEPGMRRLMTIAAIVLLRLASTLGRLNAADDQARPAQWPVPTWGGKQFWSDELFFHQWRIQRSALTGHCRLLDEHDLRHAWGTFDQCQAALEQIKQKQHLPRMRGKAVVVLHGLVRSRSAMEPLCRYLRERGGYQVFNLSYASSRCDIAEHARSLRRVVNRLDGIEEINFVGHSMGNIVIRCYLGDLARQQPAAQSAGDAAANRRAVARFHRFVMLGPPNHGARLAETLADNTLFQGIAGEAGQELGRRWPELEKRLATPDFEFAVIAGGTGKAQGYNPLLPGDNDGLVSVETAKLAGARDFAVLPLLHSFIMNDEKAQAYVLHFLKHGCFVSDRARRPIEKVP
jgi:pimeloyl-ACP methyl ester carboxylesterase